MGCKWGFREQVEGTFGRLQWHMLSGHPDDFLISDTQFYSSECRVKML